MLAHIHVHLAASAALFCTQLHVILVGPYLNMARCKEKLILVFSQFMHFFYISANIKLTFRYTVFVIYNDKSHYPSTYNVLWKTVICEENIFQLNLPRRFKKQSD